MRGRTSRGPGGPDATTVGLIRDLLLGVGPVGAPAGGVAWEFVERFVLHHGVAGLALVRHRGRAAAGQPVLPAWLEAALVPHHVGAGLQTEVRMESGARAREILSGAGIPSLFLKGAALLGDGTYQEPGARLIEDVDLLVRPEHADAAVRALLRSGFRGWVPWEHGRTQWVSAFTLDDERAPEGMRCPIDLHWSSLYGSLRLSATVVPDALWEGADAAAGLPAPEAHFVLLADHFLKHFRVVRHVRGLVDLARLAPRVQDVDALRRHARARGSELRLARVARALAGLHGVALGADVLRGLGADGPPRAEEARHLGPGALFGTLTDRPGRMSGLLVRWRLGGGVGEAVREVRHVLAPPASWLEARYPHAGTGALALRARYGLALVGWAVGLGTSPLSPNQGHEEQEPGTSAAGPFAR